MCVSVRKRFSLERKLLLPAFADSWRLRLRDQMLAF
jgi:hypothetical protein